MVKVVIFKHIFKHQNSFSKWNLLKNSLEPTYPLWPRVDLALCSPPHYHHSDPFWGTWFEN